MHNSNYLKNLQNTFCHKLRNEKVMYRLTNVKCGDILSKRSLFSGKEAVLRN